MSSVNYDEHLGVSDVKDTKKAISIRLTKKQDNQEMTLVNENSSESQDLPLDKPLARVTVGMGRTINTGNYNSAKFDISVSLPCTLDKLEETYQIAKQFCEKKGEEVLEENGLGDY